MSAVLLFSLYYLAYVQNALSSHFMCKNVTYDATIRQLYEFKEHHPKPIGLLTTIGGEPVDIRDKNLLNSDMLKRNIFFDEFVHLDGRRIPERVVHGKGYPARGYFEVTNDVSKYTKADVFNGIGKKTQILIRMSLASQERGGTDLSLVDFRGFAIKFYTNEGNLNILNLHVPVFLTKNPIDFPSLARALNNKNPKTNLFDFTRMWDMVTLKPWAMHTWLWLNSDYGVPDGYRKMDAFAIHTFEITNKHGESHFVRFNFRTEQGLANLTIDEIRRIQGEDIDYYNRDLYNAIKNKDYPSWRLEMDVLSSKDIKHLDYDPFDITRLWKNGTYHTVTIGRVVLDEVSDNYFRDAEQSVFNPASLVPGIPGPVDYVFRARRFSYFDAQNHRVGRNHDRISVNSPKYMKTYNRDSHPPVRENMKDAPDYYPNSFNGPITFVDDARPKENLLLLQSNAVDLQPAADFYHCYVKDERHRCRLADKLALTLRTVKHPVLERSLELLYLTDRDLGERVTKALKTAGDCII